MKEKKERCDRCKKWVRTYELFTLPEELYPKLHGDNEFAVCGKCSDKYTIEQWETWVVSMRESKKRGG